MLIGCLRRWVNEAKAKAKAKAEAEAKVEACQSYAALRRSIFI